MNKTVDINLANILFHIDEKAYNKLQRYLEAIRRSFTGTPGSDEILADIEARIAELFQEKLENERQVISLKEVDEVITIMGQPEDYMVDEDIFEDASQPAAAQPTRVKKLYRDIDHKYIGGVCSGLEHYLRIDALWIRLLFIFFALFTGFGFIAYILLWILVPEAATTSQKLDMRGEPVNISNIEKKVKEGFDQVADRVRNVDYQKMGDQVKSGGRSFFDALGDIILFIFKVIGKFIGILLIIIGAATLIGLFIGLFTVGILDIVHIPGIDFYDLMNSTYAPVWLVSLLIFFAVGIPFFFLLYLGLKILVSNLNSIGNIAKFSLLGLWLLAIIALAVLGIQQASAHAYTGSTREVQPLFINGTPDTLLIRMNSSDLYESQEDVGINGMTLAHDSEGERLLFSDGVQFNLKKSSDSLVHIHIRKEADGSSISEARERAGHISYSYAASNGNTIILNDYMTTGAENKVRNQEVEVSLLLPENIIIRLDPTTSGHLGSRTRYDEDLFRSEVPDYLWRMTEDGRIACLNCPEETQEGGSNDNHIIINEEGVDIDIRDQGESFKMQIGKDGVKIDANENL